MGISVAELEDVYERRYGAFSLGAAAITGDADTAHDAVQEGFARAIAKREQFRGGMPEAWVWRIIERQAFDRRRASSRAGQLEESLDPTLIGAEPDPVLANAVRMLAPRRRLVVFLRYFADLSYGEIARLCEVSEGTVAATLAHAHADLRRMLELEEVGR